ncbi:transporter [Pseudomonas gingeri]|uniref:transporter n=1 Tax=Pseudomonas gingeri TaxID=117681 RepID=UPI0015A33552|nr:transporter [Pseudomonas gingeri]NWA28593.1 transporter [Pseudomonas gingeri]
MKITTFRTAICLTLVLGSEHAAALDLAPGDYVHLPAGTVALVHYANYATGSQFKDKNGNEVPDSSDRLVLGIERALYYGETNGIDWAVQAVLPFGKITDARIGGSELPRNNGVGDLTLGAAVWAMHSTDPTGTTLGFTSYITLPTGTYHPLQASLGSGAVALTQQIGFSQGLGHGFKLDASADANFRFDHTNDGIQVSHDPNYQLQSYLSYNLTPATALSFGYSGTFGGKTTLNGIDSGTRTREDQLRVFASTFVAPTVQIQGMVGTDINVRGGFQQDLILQLRVATLF